MKKLKWLLGLCLVMLVVCGSGVSAQASDVGTDSETDVSDFIWIKKSDGTIYIHRYSGTDETVIIPSEIDGKTVSSIDSAAFSNNNVLKHVIMPEGITIGQRTFKNCKKLETIQLSEGIKFIPREAFSGCSNLEQIYLPSTLEEIGFQAFLNCTKLEKIKFPSSLTDIHPASFDGCDNLIEIEFTDGIIVINFLDIIKRLKLEKMIIPDSVKEISFLGIPVFPDTLVIYATPNSYARTYANQEGIKFSCLNSHDWNKGAITTKATAIKNGVKTYTCTACKKTKTKKIPKFGLPKNGTNVTDSKSKSIYKVTKSAAKNGTVELEKVNNSKSSITIPDTITVDGVTYKVTSVSKNVFKNNKKLKNVTIGKNVEAIGANAFYGCNNLKTVTVKSTQLKTVGKNTFKGINSKAKIKVPKSKLKSYKQLLAKKGQESTVEITK